MDGLVFPVRIEVMTVQGEITGFCGNYLFVKVN